MTPTGASNMAKDISGGAGSEASTARETIKGNGAEVADTVRDFVARGSAAAADLSDGAKAHLGAAADRVSDGASDTFDAGKRAYRTSSEAVGRQVARQPLEALMLAAAIGYLVGWAANRS